MKPEILSIIIAIVTLALAVKCDDFKEEIFIKPLPPSHLYVNFNFVTLIDGDVCKYCKMAIFLNFIS